MLRPVCEPGSGRSPPPYRVDDLDRFVGVQVLVVVVVDPHDRSVDACPETLELAEGDLAIGAGLAELDVEMSFEPGEDVHRAPQLARCCCADPHVVLADRAQVEHLVERRDLVDANARHVEEVGDGVHGHSRQPPVVLALREVEEREHGARLAPLRIAGDEVLGTIEIRRREAERIGLEGVRRRLAAHRSISPKTMS